MTENENKPAFPVIQTEKRSGVNDWGNVFSTGGLTKREIFAAIAMQGLLANSGGISGDSSRTYYEATAQESISLADALLNQLNKTNGQ